MRVDFFRGVSAGVRGCAGRVLGVVSCGVGLLRFGWQHGSWVLMFGVDCGVLLCIWFLTKQCLLIVAASDGIQERVLRVWQCVACLLVW